MKKLFIHILLVLIMLTGFCFIMDANSSPLAKQNPVNKEVANNDIHTAKANVQGEVQLEFEPDPAGSFLSKGVIIDNWGILSLGLLSFLEIIVRITPSEKDNSIFNFVSRILNAVIPNLRKGGGKY